MLERLEKFHSNEKVYSFIYEHGTHFSFPERMIKKMLPIGSSLLVSLVFKTGRYFKKECKKKELMLMKS